jgi:hypothetical protein
VLYLISLLLVKYAFFVKDESDGSSNGGGHHEYGKLSQKEGVGTYGSGRNNNYKEEEEEDDDDDTDTDTELESNNNGDKVLHQGSPRRSNVGDFTIEI